MASKDDSKRGPGRPLDQLTEDGTGSAASVGPGGTGDIDRSLTGGDARSRHSGGRTDDLLSGSTQEDADGFRSTGQTGELQTGMDGIGELAKGNRQSAARVPHKSDRGS